MSRDLSNLTPAQRRIRGAATSVGMDLDEVARKIGISVKTLGAFGSEKYPLSSNPDRAAAICETCGCPMGWLRAGWQAVHVEAPEDQAAAERLARVESELRRVKREALTHDRFKALIDLELIAAGVKPAAGESDEERRGSTPQAG